VSLTPRQRQRGKALAHGLSPMLHLGQNGLTAAVTAKTDALLTLHGLVKVKIAAEGKAGATALAEQLCAATRSELVSVVGKTAVLFRAGAEGGATLDD
jgi:putative YhbY family RNA-binding protein